MRVGQAVPAARVLARDPGPSRMPGCRQVSKCHQSPGGKILEMFDCTFPPPLCREQIRSLRVLHFVRRKENATLRDAPGVGKAHRAIYRTIRATEGAELRRARNRCEGPGAEGLSSAGRQAIPFRRSRLRSGPHASPRSRRPRAGHLVRVSAARAGRGPLFRKRTELADLYIWGFPGATPRRHEHEPVLVTAGGDQRHADGVPTHPRWPARRRR